MNFPSFTGSYVTDDTVLSVLSEAEGLSSVVLLSELSAELPSELVEESTFSELPEFSVLLLFSCSDTEVEPPILAYDDVSEEVCEELQAVSAAVQESAREAAISFIYNDFIFCKILSGVK